MPDIPGSIEETDVRISTVRDNLRQLLPVSGWARFTLIPFAAAYYWLARLAPIKA